MMNPSLSLAFGKNNIDTNARNNIQRHTLLYSYIDDVQKERGVIAMQTNTATHVRKVQYC